jgi:hypothetical protein
VERLLMDNDELMRRALEALFATAGKQRPEASSPGDGELVRLVMHCAITRRPYIVVTEHRGGTLKMMHNEDMPRGDAGAALAALGAFDLDATSWTGCLYCGTREGKRRWFWGCCGGVIHCPGRDWRGRMHCACGKVHRIEDMRPVDALDVRSGGGSRVAHATRPRR